jgi:DNA-binding response OmpR family regulator
MGKRVLYIEKEKFLRTMMELALRAKGAEIHTVEALRDNIYLLNDLSPQLILFDLETCEKDQKELEELYQYSTKAKLVAVVKDSSLQLDPRVSGKMDKPLEATRLAEKILSLID